MAHDDLFDILDKLDAIRERLIEQASLFIACSHVDDAITAINDHLDNTDLIDDEDEIEDDDRLSA